MSAERVLRVLVADDERPARERLCPLLRALPDLEVAGEASNGLEALEEAARLKPDAILLDIDMPELDGLDVASVAVARRSGGGLRCTAYDAHAVKAFELSAVDYLVKPVAEERLAEAIGRLRERCARGDVVQHLGQYLKQREAPRRMAVRCGAKFVVFDPARVAAILARDHYAAILVEGRELLSEDGLDELLARLDEDVFVRVHRSGIINVAFLKELQHEGDRRYVAVPVRSRSDARAGQPRALAGAQGEARVELRRQRRLTSHPCLSLVAARWRL